MAFAVCSNLPLAAVPNKVTAAIQTTAIKATISTYSTSEAPSSSLTQLRQRLRLFFHICASLSNGRETFFSPPFPSFSLVGPSPHRRVGGGPRSLLSSGP